MSVLSVLLASTLPASLHYKAYHIATPSVSSSALFSPRPSEKFEPTECANHLLLVTVDGGETLGHDEVIAFAIEIFVYTTSSLITIFVSKADSTGQLGLLKKPIGTPSILRATSTAFLQYLIDAQPRDRKIVISLFARAQNQYLFPGSIENVGKHVLDDRQLIKWWCRTIDPLLGPFKNSEDGGGGEGSLAGTAEAYVVVPGCDQYETRSFFPPTARNISTPRPRWHATHPLYLLAGVENPRAAPPPRCLVPRFPDDPKSRFLDDLDDEIRLPDSQEVGSEGRWRSVKTLEQFWEMMSYRQECSAGRLVGFVWMVMNPQQGSAPPEMISGSRFAPMQSTSNGIMVQDDPPLSAVPQIETMVTPAQSFQEPSAIAEEPTISSPDKSALQSPPPSSPVLAPTEPIPIEPTPTQSPTVSPLILTVDSYNSLLSHLTNKLDFSTLALAIESTQSFFTLASQKAGLPKEAPWQGELVAGNLVTPAPEHSSRAGPAPHNPSQTKRDSADAVHVLTTGIRKKRKATTTSSDASMVSSLANPDVTAASSRAETLAATVPASNGSANAADVDPATENGNGKQAINTLAAGLVRKKKKVD